MYSPEDTTLHTLESNEIPLLNPEAFEDSDISVEDFSQFADAEKEAFKMRVL